MAARAQLAAPPSCLPQQKNAAAERHVFVVCNGEHCRNAGSHGLLALLRNVYARATRNRQDLRVGASQCMGHCVAAPAVMADGRLLSWVSPRRLRSELMRFGLGAHCDHDA